MNISPKSAVELLEIINYLDDELIQYIPEKFESYLQNIKDKQYHFEIDKNKPLFENNFMDETINALSIIFKDLW